MDHLRFKNFKQSKSLLTKAEQALKENKNQKKY